jgi:hypothetical protein
MEEKTVWEMRVHVESRLYARVASARSFTRVKQGISGISSWDQHARSTCCVCLLISSRSSRHKGMSSISHHQEMALNDSYIILLAHFCALIMLTIPLTIHVTIDLPPPKRRKTLAGSLVSTALSAALIGTAVGLTVYRLCVVCDPVHMTCILTS